MNCLRVIFVMVCIGFYLTSCQKEYVEPIQNDAVKKVEIVSITPQPNPDPGRGGDDIEEPQLHLGVSDAADNPQAGVSAELYRNIDSIRVDAGVTDVNGNVILISDTTGSHYLRLFNPGLNVSDTFGLNQEITDMQVRI